MKAIFRDDEVRIIKTLLYSGVMTHQQIADLFGVGRQNITKIANNQRYSYVVVDKPKTIKRLILVEYEKDTEYIVRNL